MVKWLNRSGGVQSQAGPKSKEDISPKVETKHPQVDKTHSGKTLYCSFCGKSQHEVRKLIAGPTVFICDECTTLCMDIVRDVAVEGAKAPELPQDADRIRYDALAQGALRDLIRVVMTRAAKSGLPGAHHLQITINTRTPGIEAPIRLMERYPDQLTIVLQHQFWDLAVRDGQFAVTLSFDGARERIIVPFAAIRRFCDPSVGFSMQFEELR